jgi:hypothetical protein
MGGTGLELGTADYADALARDPERRMRLTKFTVEATSVAPRSSSTTPRPSSTQ